MRRIARPSAVLLLVASGCPTPSSPADQPSEGSTSDEPADPTVDPTASPMDGGSDSSGGSPEACPGVADPECTTNAGCSNDSVCVDCMCVEAPDACGDEVPECITEAECGTNELCISCQCVHDCSMQAAAECNSNAECEAAFGSGSVCAKTPQCVCVQDLGCSATDECQSEQDCPAQGPCSPDTCTCECECSMSSDSMACQDGWCDGCDCQPFNGESDPENDCEVDFGTAECNPSIDILDTEIGCDGDTLTVSVTYDEAPIDPMPEAQTTRVLELFDSDGFNVLRLWANASTFRPSEYDCEVIIVGQAGVPLGPDDVCQISEGGSRFEYRLSPESAALAAAPLASLASYASTSAPMLHFDMSDTYPFACP